MKRLIVNADDLGLTRPVNRGIVEAHRHGIVTSATLMANGGAFDDAVALARAEPRLAVGCHVDLVQLAPTSPVEQVPSLCDGRHFRHGLGMLAARSVAGRIDAVQVESEAAAQIRKLQSAGIRVSHIDTHKHAHVLPRILEPLLRAARSCGVQAIRNPFEPGTVARVGPAFARGELKRWAAVRILSGMSRGFRRRVHAAGLRSNDGTIGIVFTGKLDQQILCDLLRGVPEGTWELVTHPGYTDAELATLSRLTAQRESELRLLTSAETRATISAAGIELITYSDLSG